jgi:abortive infection bacteriophage resistance protein
VMFSWLHTLNYVRNICAHHARLWNRDLAVQPQIPEASNDSRWHGARAIGKKRIFVVLTLLNCLLKEAAPNTKWRDRLFALIDKYPNVPLKMMGIPADWRTHDLWR